MFGLGAWEIMLILAVALIFIGPKKLPEVAAQIGKMVRDLNRTANDFTREITHPPPDVDQTLASIETPHPGETAGPPTGYPPDPDLESDANDDDEPGPGVAYAPQGPEDTSAEAAPDLVPADEEVSPVEVTRTPRRLYTEAPAAAEAPAEVAAPSSEPEVEEDA